MNTNIIKAKTIPKAIRQIILTIICTSSLILTLNATQAFANNLPKETLRDYSANNIYFYRPCDFKNSGNFSSICGNTAREKYWSALRQYFSDVQTAAIFGSIDHEGSFGPTLWQYTIVPAGSGQFKSGITWDQLYNCENGKCPGGVGAFQITWELGSYLRQINDKNPDLIKYFKDPTYSLPGDQLLEKIGATDFDRLVTQEIELFVLGTRKGHSDNMKKYDKLDDATDYWTSAVENCKNCCGEADDDHSCEQIELRRASAKKRLDEMKPFTCNSSFSSSSSTSSSSSSSSGGGTYAGGKYNFTDEQLKRLWWAAKNEEGEAGDEGIKTELSFFANRYESNIHHGTPGNEEGLIASVLSSDYDTRTHTAYNGGAGYSNPTPDQINAAKDILNNGNRTLPPQVFEHDMLTDIVWATNDGTQINKDDRSQYISGTTIISNRYRNEDDPYDPPYVFFRWANGETVCSSNNCGDPFGWKTNEEAPSQSATTSNASSDPCPPTGGTASSTGNLIADTALQLSYFVEKKGTMDPKVPKPEYLAAMQVAHTEGDWSGEGEGASCDQFVATVMISSGADPNFNLSVADCSGQYMMHHPELYEEINFNGSNFEVLRPGDIFSTFSPTNDPSDACAQNGHIYIYAELNGQRIRADASSGGRTAEHYYTDPVDHDSTNSRPYRKYKVFRRK